MAQDSDSSKGKKKTSRGRFGAGLFLLALILAGVLFWHYGSDDLRNALPGVGDDQTTTPANVDSTEPEASGPGLAEIVRRQEERAAKETMAAAEGDDESADAEPASSEQDPSLDLASQEQSAETPTSESDTAAAPDAVEAEEPATEKMQTETTPETTPEPEQSDPEETADSREPEPETEPAQETQQAPDSADTAIAQRESGPLPAGKPIPATRLVGIPDRDAEAEPAPAPEPEPAEQPGQLHSVFDPDWSAQPEGESAAQGEPPMTEDEAQSRLVPAPRATTPSQPAPTLEPDAQSPMPPSTTPSQPTPTQRAEPAETAALPDNTVKEPAPDTIGRVAAVGVFVPLEPTPFAEGRAVIYTQEDDTNLLRLEDLRLPNRNSLLVALTAHAPANATDLDPLYLDLGPLKGNRGDQNYPLPTNSKGYAAVVIYDVIQERIVASAPLERQGAARELKQRMQEEMEASEQSGEQARKPVRGEL